MAKTVLQNFAMSAKKGDDFAAVVARANDRLCEGNDQMMFVTVFFGVLDLRTGRFDYVNAGHNPPLVVRKGAEPVYLVPEGKADKPLGVREGLSYRQGHLSLAPGEMIFFYTDGVTEATNEAQELYGETRLQQELARADAGAPVPDVLARLRGSLQSFVGDAEQADDITMLGLRYWGEKRS